MQILVVADALSGAAAGAIMGLLVAGVGYIASALMQKKGSGMGAPHVANLIWPGDYRAGLEAAKKAIHLSGGKFLSEDGESGMLIGKVAANLTSFGTAIRFQFAGQPGAISVELATIPALPGNDRRRAEKLLSELQRHWFAAGGTSAGAPPR